MMPADNLLSELFQQAGRCHDRGDVSEAMSLYDRVLEIQPDHVDALYRSGLLECGAGHFDSGIDRISRAVVLAPNFHEALYNLGVAYTDRGDIPAAIAVYRRAIAVNPQFAQSYYNLAIALTNQGLLNEAVDAYGKAIAVQPNYPEAHCNLGVALEKLGRSVDAVAAYRQAVKLNPNWPQACFNLGRMLQAMPSMIDEAISNFRKAVALKPDFWQAWCHLGDALTRTGRTDDIIFAYRQAILHQPDHAEAHFNLGVALAQKGETEEAIDACRKAISLQPKFAAACYQLALLHKTQGEHKAAANMFRKTIDLRPDDGDALYHLGWVLNEQGKLDDAADAYRRVIALRPDYPQALNNLAIVLKNAGKIQEAISAYRKAIAIRPDFVDAHSNLLMTLHYSVESTAQTLREEHRQWDSLHAQPLLRSVAPHTNIKEIHKKLRIGYVSGDFWDHAAARFILPLLANHHREAFEILCYSNSSKTDMVTDKIRQNADGWRNITNITDESAARIIRDDQIDILVDLSMHTQGNRLLVFARKPAPVQATWLGYAGTTGMKAVDWRLTDSFLDPINADEHIYAERSMRLPHSFWCYHPIHPTGQVNPLPAVETGQITFGCFNNFAKVSVPAQELWARILSELPASRLILHCQQGSHRAELLERFARHGIEASRIEFIGRLPLLEYMDRYRQIDIALDPFPFTGGTTTCDALWMGVPVVTLRGNTAVGRSGASLLCNAGLGDWVAGTAEEYVQIACKHASDLPSLALLRSALREQMRQSPLMDGRRFASDLESAYAIMWRDWCDRG
jgi:predicted O-linked N-acetylglucosamine transferase (SPINDLY family)